MDNAPHLHLMINHLPVFSSLLALPLLALALLRKQDAAGLVLASCMLMLATGLGGAVSMVTGKGAEAETKQLPGVEEKFIDEHEAGAAWAAGLAALGALAALGVGALTLKGGSPKTAAVVALLVLDLLAASTMGRVGQLGGKIRHTEVR